MTNTSIMGSQSLSPLLASSTNNPILAISQETQTSSPSTNMINKEPIVIYIVLTPPQTLPDQTFRELADDCMIEVIPTCKKYLDYANLHSKKFMDVDILSPIFLDNDDEFKGDLPTLK